MYELRPCEALILSILRAGPRHHFKLPLVLRGAIGRVWSDRLVALSPGDTWTITMAGQRAIARHDFNRSASLPRAASPRTAVWH